MRTESKAISIPDLLKEGKYEGSIITTFNAYLPYYEEIVLRKLQTCGCRNNVLLMDERQLAECLKTESLRPRLAGFEYTLVPIRASGAFHPKIICLLSEKKGCVLVGSHNLTLSGLNKNRELTTKVRFSSLKDQDAVTFITQVFNFMRSCIEQQSDFVPDELSDSVNRLTNIAPWLKISHRGENSGFRFLGATANGAALYEQFLMTVPRNAKRIFVIGPFFDRKLEFLKRIKEDLSPSEVVVGIDPSTVDILPNADTISGVRFVNASSLGLNSSYLHAKIVYVETESKNDQLVTGSANPSSPAWLASSNTRNIEAIVLHAGETAKKIAVELGVSELNHAEDISQRDWEEIAQRVKESPTNPSQPAKPIIIATVEPDGIVFDAKNFQTDLFKQAEIYDESVKKINSIYQLEQMGDKILIPVQEEELRITRTVSISGINGPMFTTWVHHTAEISRRSESSRQAQFRMTMASLETGDPDLPNLIHIVERVIFEDDIDIDSKAVKRSAQRAKPEDNIDETVQLSLSLDDIKKAKRRRIVNSGDLGLIMDVLIHNLGIGLKSRGPGTYSDGRDEEDMIGSDDEEPPEILSALTSQEIVKICNTKVRTIVNRLLKQFENAETRESEYYKPLIQLVAVVALFRQLRKFESANTTISLSESLIPEKDRERLLFGTLPFLYGEKSRFFEKANAELVDEPIDEISRLKGLLLWLAKDVGIDIRPRKQKRLGIDYSALQRESIERARAIVLAQIAVTDEVSFDEAKNSIYHTTTDLEEAVDWIDRHKTWGRKFSLYIQKLKDGKNGKGKQPKIGDLVFLNKPEYDFFHVVYSASNFSKDIKLVGIEGEENIRTCSIGNLCFFSFPKIK